MSSFPMEVGRVVFSKAGRDAGHYFVVVAVLDKDHVAIANGCQRKVDNPKKKKIKHLVAKPEVLEEIREKIFAKKRIFVPLVLFTVLPTQSVQDQYESKPLVAP